MARTSTCRPSSSRPRRIFRPYQDQLHPGRPRSGALPPRPRCLVPTPRARLGTGAQPSTNRAHLAQPAREHRDTPRPAVAHRAALRASPRPSPLARPCCSYFALLVCTALAVGAALPPAHLSSSCCSPSPRGWAGQRRGGRLPRQAAGGSSRRWAGGRHDDGGGREGDAGGGVVGHKGLELGGSAGECGRREPAKAREQAARSAGGWTHACLLFVLCVCAMCRVDARWKRGRLTRCRCECTRYVNSSILYSVYDASAHERSEKYIALMGVRARPERRGRRETARLWLCPCE